ncbi:hypothetical protein [Pseudofrankia asymbiotica]|nr:hypothetical protein [Pseudofrankia asymbiotica]
MSGPVLVSVTDFTSARSRSLPGIARAGFGLRRSWPRLDGAVGLWLWAEPLARRTGAVSVWTDEEALRGFARWPPHTTIMRRYRGRGQVRAMTWEAHRFDEAEVWRQAYRWLTRSTHVPEDM